MSESHGWKLKFFSSIDLVGSTAYKVERSLTLTLVYDVLILSSLRSTVALFAIVEVLSASKINTKSFGKFFLNASLNSNGNRTPFKYP